MAQSAPQEVRSTEQIFRDLAPFVLRALRRLGVREADVDDVVQEVFIVVHRRLSDFEGRSTIKTWVYGIAVRVASDYRRRAPIRREVLTEPELDRADSSPDPEERAARRQAVERLDRILDDLDDDKRAVFVLYEIEGLVMNDVASAVGVPLQTAYSRLHAARKIVQERLRAARGSTPSERRPS